MTDVLVTEEVVDYLRRTGGVRGWVPVVDLEGPNLTPVPKLRLWWDDPILRDRDTGELVWNPDHAPGASSQTELEVGPEPKRTSAREKFDVLVKLLTAEARKFTVDGVTTWPASVQRELDEAAWKMGKAGELSTEEQVELLARTYIVHGANKQKEQDRNPNSQHPSRGHYAA